MLQKTALSLCFTLFLGLLCACSPDSVLRLTQSESLPPKTTKNTKDSEKHAKNDAEIGAPVALPPSFGGDTPLAPGQTSAETMPNGLPALKPMKGVNVDALFSEKLKNPDERFGRVENAVIDLRKEFEVYKPAIVRLAAVESDIQNLIKELEVVLQETPHQQHPAVLSDHAAQTGATLDIGQLDPQPEIPPDAMDTEHKTVAQKGIPPPAALTPKAPRKTQKDPPPMRHFASPSALNFRTARHGDMVRIAFDASQKTPFRIDIDNKEKLLIIELPGIAWQDKESRSFPHSTLLDSLRVHPLPPGGSMLVITLKKEARILQEKSLPPDKSSPYHRIYFDLAP